MLDLSGFEHFPVLEKIHARLCSLPASEQPWDDALFKAKLTFVQRFTSTTPIPVPDMAKVYFDPSHMSLNACGNVEKLLAAQYAIGQFLDLSDHYGIQTQLVADFDRDAGIQEPDSSAL